MLNFLLSKIFPPMPALIISHSSPFSEAAMDAAQDRARELTGSGPTFREDDMKAVLKAMEDILSQPVIEDAPASQRGGYRPGAGRPRKFGFYDLEVGRSCRAPRSAATSVRAAAYTHARTTGKVFTTRTHANGLWIKRVA